MGSWPRSGHETAKHMLQQAGASVYGRATLVWVRGRGARTWNSSIAVLPESRSETLCSTSCELMMAWLAVRRNVVMHVKQNPECDVARSCSLLEDPLPPNTTRQARDSGA